MIMFLTNLNTKFKCNPINGFHGNAWKPKVWQMEQQMVRPFLCPPPTTFALSYYWLSGRVKWRIESWHDAALEAPEVVIMTTSHAAGNDKVGIITTLGFQCPYHTLHCICFFGMVQRSTSPWNIISNSCSRLCVLLHISSYIELAQSAALDGKPRTWMSNNPSTKVSFILQTQSEQDRVYVIQGPISQIVDELITEISCEILFVLIIFLMIRSGHNFAHVTTAELSWHVQNCDMTWLPFFT